MTATYRYDKKMFLALALFCEKVIFKAC